MSFLAIGAAVVSTAVGIVTSEMAQNKQKKAAEEGQQQATVDANLRELNARKAQTFASTEGQGQGSQGQVNLQVDKNVGTGTINDTKGLTL